MANASHNSASAQSNSNGNEIEDLMASFTTEVKSPDAFVAIDYDFTFLFVNRVAEKFYGKLKKELLGHRVPNVFPQHWDFGPFKAVRKNVSARKPFEISYHSPFVTVGASHRKTF